MMGLNDLKKNEELIESIDWSMTPEEAVRLYLEWGNNWSRGYRMVRTREDTSHYFVLNTWEENPVIYFVRRDYEGAVELAKIEIPDKLQEESPETKLCQKGVFGVDGKLKDWLMSELNVN